MKKRISLIFAALLLVSGCSSTEKNTIAVTELTDREAQIVNTASDNSFVFDYQTDGSFKEIHLWIEKYESGEMTKEYALDMTAPLQEDEKSGTIVLAVSQNEEGYNHFSASIGGIGGSTDDLIHADKVDQFASTWGTFPPVEGKPKDISGEMLLAHIAYQAEMPMSSLSIAAFEDMESNMDALKEYDVIYLVKAEFVE